MVIVTRLLRKHILMRVRVLVNEFKSVEMNFNDLESSRLDQPTFSKTCIGKWHAAACLLLLLLVLLKLLLLLYIYIYIYKYIYIYIYIYIYTYMYIKQYPAAPAVSKERQA